MPGFIRVGLTDVPFSFSARNLGFALIRICSLHILALSLAFWQPTSSSVPLFDQDLTTVILSCPAVLSTNSSNYKTLQQDLLRACTRHAKSLNIMMGYLQPWFQFWDIQQAVSQLFDCQGGFRQRDGELQTKQIQRNAAKVCSSLESCVHAVHQVAQCKRNPGD